MKKTSPKFKIIHCRAWLPAVCVATMVSACGGGASNMDSQSSASGQKVETPLASGTTTLQLDVATLPTAAAEQVALPTFHVAPVLLNAPDDVDSADNVASARMSPRTQVVPVEFESLSTRRLTVQALESVRHMRVMSALTADGSGTPMAAGSMVATYSPAQIRAAYGMPSLPSVGATLTASQAAQLGAGQTIYLVDAMSDPNIASELAAFNQKFGLPTCTTQTIATNAALPLATASASSCVLSIVYNTAGGAMTSAAPPYDAGWATEIALDVQWSHATAPLARIILIEAPNASIASFLGAVNLANSMGAGVVSMSFGTQEGNWTASVDSVFTGHNMTYVASTGDSGASVQWPAVSPNVVAVGGTTLTYSGTGVRSEMTWSDTGGGISQYTPTPIYQNSAVPGMGTAAHRTVADVAFNADPSTGQYVAVITQGSSTVMWASVGGTSLGAPQWSGIVAVANASRALSAKPALGDPHTVLYGQISTVPGSYASEFDDITKGSDGSCSTCSAKVGYDQVTGLGTPNVADLLSTLTGAPAVATAPVVTSASIGGQVGTTLSFTVSVADTNPVTYTLSGSPSGMSISSTGAVTWVTPAIGFYSVVVTAKDTKTGLSGNGIYTVIIAAQPGPGITSAIISGQVGTALSFAVSVTDPNPVTCVLSGAPSGMAISSAGAVTWPTPLAGTYSVTVTARDPKTGQSGQGVFMVKITAAAGPVVTAAAMTGVVGQSLTGMISISDPGVSSLSVSISGAPMGMMFSVTGLTFTTRWASPVLGSYSLKISVADSAGRSTQTIIPITITAK